VDTTEHCFLPIHVCDTDRSGRCVCPAPQQSAERRLVSGAGAAIIRDHTLPQAAEIARIKSRIEILKADWPIGRT